MPFLPLPIFFLERVVKASEREIKRVKGDIGDEEGEKVKGEKRKEDIYYNNIKIKIIFIVVIY
jgi:hypothetical protein